MAREDLPVSVDEWSDDGKTLIQCHGCGGAGVALGANMDAAEITRRGWLGLALAALAGGVAMAEAGEPALVAAAGRGDEAAVRRLLAAGAAVDARDSDGRTALLAATHADNAAIARLLIAAGADVNARDAIADSPFLYAGAEGRNEILALTLAAGADLASTNRYGGTALIPAAHHGHVETVRMLLATPIAIDHINNLGWTALLEAVILGDGGPAHTEIVRLLVEVGAGVNLADGGGITPLAHAERRGQGAIAALLRAAAPTR